MREWRRREENWQQSESLDFVGCFLLIGWNPPRDEMKICALKLEFAVKSDEAE